MKKLLPILLCTISLVLGSCGEDPEPTPAPAPDPVLTVSPQSLVFTSEGGAQNIQVKATNSWTASASGTGISVSPMSGEGDATVTVTAAATNSTDQITGTVSFSSKGLSASVSVVQEERKVLKVGDGLTIPSEGGTFAVDIEYNTDYTVEVSSDAKSWITFVATRALQSGKLEFQFAENPDTDARQGRVTIKDKSGKAADQTLTFVQAEKKVIRVGDGNSANVPVSGGTVEFTIHYNTSYTIEIESSAQSWLHFVETRAMQSGTLVFSVDANKGEGRTGKATVKDKEGKAGAITLTFEQEPYIAVSTVQISLEAAELEIGETLTLTATVLPEDATDKTVTWSTDNEMVATVSEDGTVKAITVGTATITATAGEVKASCVITVIPSAYERDRAALMALYEATGGKNWTRSDNWCSDKPFGEWFGVATDSKGRVTSISLVQNNLTGHIPADVFSLYELIALDLQYNELTGEIPAEVGNAKKLGAIKLQHNKLTGTIPESIYGLDNLYMLELWSNKLSGELSEKFWSMPSLEHLAVDDNKITGQLTAAVAKAKKLRWLGVGSNLLKGTIPAAITELTELMYFSIENHPVSNGTITETQNEISGPIPSNLDKLRKLHYFLVENNNLEGNLPKCLAQMPVLKCLEVYGNRLSGEIPEEVVACENWDVWAPDANIMPQQEGYVLSFSHYESRDFSEDGKVIKLQTHEKGNGINVVITGDCFTDQDIAAGEFDAVARQTMEDFFGIEPFTTFRNLFDVYAVVAVSKTRYGNYGTAMDAVFGEGSYVYCDEDKVKGYTRKAVDDLNETLTIVIVNKNRNSGTAYMPYPSFDTDYGSGFSYACFGLMSQGDARRLLINHEANGHGFTKLLDEYYYSGSGTFPAENIPYYSEYAFPRGFYANVDFESDPTKVKWARFLSDERYKYDGLGVFEGGMVVEKGVWRPSNNSIMGYQQVGHDGDRFNAPSREAAYIRIHKLAYGSDWKYDYEEFVKYDAINRKTSAEAKSSKTSARVQQSSFQHTPPVMIGKNKSRLVH